MKVIVAPQSCAPDVLHALTENTLSITSIMNMSLMPSSNTVFTTPNYSLDGDE